jgi:hypothetical protein
MALKTNLLTLLKARLDERLQTAWAAMQAAQESANSEEKSSAGDKYETARAMGQIERDRHAKQYEVARQERLVLDRIEHQGTPERAALGALLDTTTGWYFLAVSAGAVTVDGVPVIVVSPQSPLGQVLVGKSPGEGFDFRGTKGDVRAIY